MQSLRLTKAPSGAVFCRLTFARFHALPINQQNTASKTTDTRVTNDYLCIIYFPYCICFFALFFHNIIIQITYAIRYYKILLTYQLYPRMSSIRENSLENPKNIFAPNQAFGASLKLNSSLPTFKLPGNKIIRQGCETT